MNQMIRSVQKNSAFKFISSVKLAVPLMIVIAAVVAAGTLYESQYNAQVARIIIYQTWWFRGLMGLLWLNIFSAALSRYPYKEHHIGFLITHLGLLTLLVGGQMTSLWGVDGQLRVVEGQSSRTILLDNMVIKLTRGESQPIEKFSIERSLSPQTGDKLGLTHLREVAGISVDNYLPFVTEETVYVPTSQGTETSGVALSFSLQSPFFNVTQSLHSIDRPEMQMGPAQLRLITDSAAKPKPQRKAASVSNAKSGEQILVVSEGSSGKELERIPLSKLRVSPVTIHGVRVTLVKAYEQAVVAANKIVENGTPGANPALELRVEQGGKSLREITYAKFSGFSLNAHGTFGLKFAYVPGGLPAAEHEDAEARQIPMHSEQDSSPPANGNVIEFHVSPSNTQSANLVLYKNGEKVMAQTVRAGETLQTPWMGMKITVNSIVANGTQKTEVRPAEMQPKLPLFPSAVYVRSDLPNTEGAWLIQGEARTIQTSRGIFEIYYGEDSVDLPFEIHLNQFRKVDYPGTETALSFESTIQLSTGGAEKVIKMNEPLQQDGYLLYQSSYEMGPGMPTASIFSVNQDPGRIVKYIGAIILIIGIALFTTMRTKWYLGLRRKKFKPSFAIPLSLLLILCGLIGTAAHSARADSPVNSMSGGMNGLQDLSPQAAQDMIQSFASQIDTSVIEELPVQSHGRVKPLDSLARETVLFVTGKYALWGLNPVQLFLGMSLSDATAYAPLINVRDPELRVSLGFDKSKRYFSLQELETSPLKSIADPILSKQEKNEKLLTPDDKKILEIIQQEWVVKQILTGSMLAQSVILDLSNGSDSTHGMSAGIVMEKLQQYLNALRTSNRPAATILAMELLPIAKYQQMPDLFRDSIPRLRAEVLYNHIRPFFWVGILYMLIGVTLASGLARNKLSVGLTLKLLALPILMHAAGFGARVYITGFAPVTNMYGTMVWMAFGVVAFGTVLFALYRNYMVFGLLLVGSSVTLLLTESIPLILSPDMDPIVAVLRNNFWLTIHVLTISISYAAFTIAMLIGNAALVQSILQKGTAEGFKNLAHLAYRAIQLGVFLLTAGIILGGWWADYSWGRFWGWDPKETWALIADLGFLAILHAKYVGWLDNFWLLAMAPVAYLLVIMAWYGVNFILAAGLHSYGFSSGGATIVVVFVTFQLFLLSLGIISKQLRSPAH